MPFVKDINYEIIRSNRKTMALQITRDNKVVVRCPYLVNPQRIYTFVYSKYDWIKKKLQKRGNLPEAQPFTREEIENLADKALIDIPSRVKYFANKMNLSYGNITIRNQLTRWGSCSGKRNLNFNCLLMLTSESVRNYVVIHELCHLKEMNHSKLFWAEVGKIMPDYKIYEKWLKEEGALLIRRLRKSVKGDAN